MFNTHIVIVALFGFAAAVEGFHVQVAGSALSSVHRRASRSDSVLTRLQAKHSRPTSRSARVADEYTENLYKMGKKHDSVQYQAPSPRNQQVVAHPWDVQENLGLPHEAQEQSFKKGLISLRFFMMAQALILAVRNFAVKMLALLLAPAAPVLGLIAGIFGYTRKSPESV